MEEGRGAYTVSVGKPEEKRPLERPRHRWVDNNKMYFQEVGLEGGGMDWIDQALDMDKWQNLVNAVMNNQFP
jgi:hypothetical protein